MTLAQPVAGKESHWTGVKLLGWDFQISLLIFRISGNILISPHIRLILYTTQTSHEKSQMLYQLSTEAGQCGQNCFVHPSRGMEEFAVMFLALIMFSKQKYFITKPRCSNNSTTWEHYCCCLYLCQQLELGLANLTGLRLSTEHFMMLLLQIAKRTFFYDKSNCEMV